MKKILIYTIVIFIFIFVATCEKPQQFPNEPQIDFYKIYIVDSIDKNGNPTKYHFLNFRVVDGDGNLGVKQEDSTINFFCTLYEKNNGIYEEFNFPDSVTYRIPYTDHVGLNEYFKAEIQVEIFYTLSLYNFDTIMYSFYVMDRDSNYSNVENSFDIPKNFTGLIIDTTAFNPTEL